MTTTTLYRVSVKLRTGQHRQDIKWKNLRTGYQMEKPFGEQSSQDHKVLTTRSDTQIKIDE